MSAVSKNGKQGMDLLQDVAKRTHGVNSYTVSCIESRGRAMTSQSIFVIAKALTLLRCPSASELFRKPEETTDELSTHRRRRKIKYGRIVALAAVAAFTIAAVWGPSPAFGAEQVKLALQRSQGVDQGSGEAVIGDHTLTIRVKDLKPRSVYTVWYVNMDPKHEMAGVGEAPYAFKTDRKGAATFKAKLAEQPFGRWQLLVIVRHPNGDPQDMQRTEDALWAPLAKAGGKGSVNPCAAR